MSKFVRQDVAQHESPQGVAWPGDHPVRVGTSARREKPLALIRRELESNSPRRSGLVVEHDSSGTDQPPEWEVCAFERGRDKLHAHQAVVDLFAESSQGVADIGRRGRVVPAAGRAARADNGEFRPACGADRTRICSYATCHRQSVAHERSRSQWGSPLTRWMHPCRQLAE